MICSSSVRLSETINVGYRKRFSRAGQTPVGKSKTKQIPSNQLKVSGKIIAVEKVVIEILLSMNNPTELARRQTAAEKNKFLAEKKITFSQRI